MPTLNVTMKRLLVSSLRVRLWLTSSQMSSGEFSHQSGGQVASKSLSVGCYLYMATLHGQTEQNFMAGYNFK